MLYMLSIQIAVYRLNTYELNLNVEMYVLVSNSILWCLSYLMENAKFL